MEIEKNSKNHCNLVCTSPAHLSSLPCFSPLLSSTFFIFSSSSLNVVPISSGPFSRTIYRKFIIVFVFLLFIFPLLLILCTLPSHPLLSGNLVFWQYNNYQGLNICPIGKIQIRQCTVVYKPHYSVAPGPVLVQIQICPLNLDQTGSGSGS